MIASSPSETGLRDAAGEVHRSGSPGADGPPHQKVPPASQAEGTKPEVPGPRQRGSSRHREVPRPERPPSDPSGARPEPRLTSPASAGRDKRPAAEQEPTTEVLLTIGRIEVRVQPPAPAPHAPSQVPARRPGSLEGYLQARSARRIG